MNGDQLTFFTRQERRHHGKQLGHWLLFEKLHEERMKILYIKAPIEFGVPGET